MVKITSAVLFFMIALGVQASATCQCLFSDGSHCCVYSSVNGPSEDCTQACSGARRGKDNVACNAGGKWSGVSAWNAQWREGCAR
ncbi:hypothetical protein F53441_6373 [Fusarium austroafricanum]|uniref:Uncharacterized protein n=1 Tax=Fusarium austroafricanum TaxID=2364996 RepID=A0A8H4KIU1_9HYPO|nr:hypothetical protein F53441_6373 [Fusarium austroafricanum]